MSDDHSWLSAKERGENVDRIDAGLRRRYENLESRISSLPDEAPPEGWEARVHSALARKRRGRTAAVLAAAVFAIVLALWQKPTPPNVSSVHPDAAVGKPIQNPPTDTGDGTTQEQSDLVSLSKFGFFSVTSNVKTVILIDDKMIGEIPITRLPLKPGPHTVKAIGPNDKSKIMKITIVGGRDVDEGSIEW